MFFFEDLPRSFSDVPRSTILLAVLLVTSVVLLLAHWLRPLWRLHWMSRHLPGPRGLPLLGSALDLQGSPAHVYRMLTGWHAQYGNLFRVQMLHHVAVFLSKPDDVKYLFGKLKVNNRSWLAMEPVSFFLGNGILTINDGQVYKSHRKIMNPMFYPAVLKNFRKIFEDSARIFSGKLSEVADGRNIDAISYTSLFSLETICAAVIGIDLADIETSPDELVEAVALGDSLVVRWMVQPWLSVPVLREFFHDRRENLRVRRLLRTAVEQMFSKKKKQLTEERLRPTSGGNDTASAPPSLLDLMVRSESTASLNAMAVRDEILTMIAAGVLTSASSLAFLMVLLGMHTDIQDAVSRELEEVFGSIPSPATTEDLSRLETLDRVIKETLRLFPTVPFLPRNLYEDIQLPSGKVLPGGSIIFVNTYKLHRDPESYKDPESFIPDRWLPENSVQVNQDAFIPFGTGSRHCIGFRYAMLQLKIASIHLLRKFKMATDYTMEDLRNMSGNATLRLESGFHVQLHKRVLRTAHA